MASNSIAMEVHNGASCDTEFLDFRLSSQAMLAHIQALNPLVIGLSIIFQYLTPAFARLVRLLRAQGVESFICAGGHYPSLRYSDVLATMPELDCIVRFEGEYTLLELAQRLAEGQEWRDLPSVAFLDQGKERTTPLRPLIEDLDVVPAPKRLSLPDRCLNIPLAPIMASRGCPRACSFCSIRQFYATPPGRVRRTRAPEKVVEEMRLLRDEQGVRIFLFADDDFALASRRDRDWAKEFVACLERERVAGSVLWRMSCRADEVAQETLAHSSR
jgi:anaerobic magnesium-protoporphyrin IX monomethyl ester cyclase